MDPLKESTNKLIYRLSIGLGLDKSDTYNETLDELENRVNFLEDVVTRLIRIDNKPASVGVHNYLNDVWDVLSDIYAYSELHNITHKRND